MAVEQGGGPVLGSQRDAFAVPPEIAYFNTATMSPSAPRGAASRRGGAGSAQPAVDHHRRRLVLAMSSDCGRRSPR